MIKLETKNLIVRNHIETDWESLYEYLSLPQTYTFEPGDPIDKEKAITLISERSKGDDFLAVVAKENQHMVGHLYFHRSEPNDFMTWELGFIFNPKFQGRGYCTEASAAIIKYALEQLNAHKVVAFCNPKNIASWKVLEKIGMEREGYFRQKAFFRKDSDGKPLWHDCYAYGILNDRC